MPVPTQLIPFTSFLGTYEGINPIVLPEMFSPNGSQNLYLDELGRARKILGYSQQTSSAVTTNTGADAARCVALYFYKFFASGSTTRRLVGVWTDDTNEYEIWYSDDYGATWTFLEDLGSGPVGKHTDFAQYRDDLYITIGGVAPRKLNNTTIGAAGGTQSPTPTATRNSSPTIAGTMEGTYRYKLVSVESDGSRSPGSVASSPETVELGDGIDLSWTADTNMDVVGYEVYRTTGTGTLFYYLGFVEGRTTASAPDYASDAHIRERHALNDHGDAPTSGTYFCETHGDRVWFFRTDTYPFRGWYSDIGNPESVGVFAWMDFNDPTYQGEQITAAVGNYERKLVVFTGRSVYTVSGTGSVIGNVVDFNKKRSNATAGAISHRAVQRVPAGARFYDENGRAQATDKVMLAYMTPNYDIRLFDGVSDTIISGAVRETLDGLSKANGDRVHSIHDEKRGEIVWFVLGSGQTSPTVGIAWNYRYGVWFIRTSQTFVSSVVADTTTAEQIILAGGSALGGHIYELWDGNDFNGTDIEAIWMSGTLIGTRAEEDQPGQPGAIPALPFTKRFRWADFLIETNASATLTVEWFEGYAPSNGTAFASDTFSPNDASRETTPQRIILHNSTGRYLHDVGMRFKISDNAADGQWAIEGVTLAVQVLDGLKRRSQ